MWRLKRRTDADRFTVVKWAVAAGWPLSLSVTETGDVLVVDYHGNLTVYTDDGAPTAVLALMDADIKRPLHALKTSADTYIVCHGWADTSVNRVSEVDRHGRILGVYGGARGHGPDQLSCPVHLTRGIDDGSILVVDDRRVLLLDERRQLKRVLIRRPAEAEVSGWPWDRRLCFSGEGRRLFVAWGGRYIHVYGV